MVKSMYAAVAGLNSHQSRMDVISNNIANVNTYGYKTKSASFKESMYETLTNGSAGSTIDGGYGATNPNLVGYGSMVSAIASNFTAGSPAETGNAMDCFIDGPAFFVVGPMYEDGAAQAPENVYVTRVGDFAVRDGYLVDGNGRYVYGFTVTEAGEVYKDKAITTTTPTSHTLDLPGADVSRWDAAAGTGTKIEYEQNNPTDPNGYMNVTTTVAEKKAYDASKFAGVADTENTVTVDNVTYTRIPADPATTPPTYTDMIVTNVTTKNKERIPLPEVPASDIYTDANGVQHSASFKYDSDDPTKCIKLTTTVTPAPANPKFHGPVFEDGRMTLDTENGAYTMREDVANLKPLKIPTSGTYLDENGVEQHAEDIAWDTFSIDSYGKLFGTDKNKKTYLLGIVGMANVPNPAGMTKSEGPYYQLGGSSGEGRIIQPGTNAGSIETGKLEMSNVNIATEFSTMITTERGFQANSKIITVTDEMLQELVNMKR